MSAVERTRKWRKQQREIGNCPQCGNNKSKDGKRCEDCAEKARMQSREKANERRDQGLCITCGKNSHILNKQTCQECRNKHNNW